MPRVWIGGANNHPFDSGGHDRLRTRRCATMRATWLQSHIERCPLGGLASMLSVPNGFDFRMWRTGAAVPAPADDPTAFDQKRPDHRIRRSCAVTTTGQAQCLAHVFEFSAHPTKLRRPC